MEDEASSTRLCLLLSLLPEDLIINNILLKLPVRSVMRLRCVCKYFWSLTTNPSFVNLHLHHAKTVQLINNHPALILISYLDQYQTRQSDWDSLYYFSTLKQLILTNTTPTTPTTTSCCLSSSGPGPGPEDQDDNTNTVVVVEEVKIPCVHRSTSPPHIFQIWGSCNGLLCVKEAPDESVYRPRRYDEYNGPYYYCLPCIWNPCTREFKKLPPPMELYRGREYHRFVRVQHHGFGYDPTMDDYKVIVWIYWKSFRPHVPSKSIINVYTLGATNSNFPLWRSCANSSYKRFRIKQYQREAGLYFRGALHWVIEVADNHLMEEGPFRKQIVSFDIKAEAIRELVPRPPPHPHGCSEAEQDWVLQELRGCLCLLIYSTTHEKRIIDVWMMKEDYGCCSCWTNLLTIVAEPPAEPPGYSSLFRFDPRLASIPLRLCENGEILILEDEQGLYMYDPNTKTTRSIIETRDIMTRFRVFYMETYIESLVSLKTVFPAAL